MQGNGCQYTCFSLWAVLNSVEHMVMDGDSCIVICFHRHPFRPSVVKNHDNTTILFAFLFDLADAHLADFRGGCDMGTATGL